MNTAKVAVGTAAGVLGLIGAAALGSSELMSSTDTVTVATFADTIADNQYQGTCVVVTPPEPDPCDAAQGQIKYSMLGHLVNAIPYKNWRKGAPQDAARIDAVLANPQCPTANNPQPQTLTTFMGAAIADAVKAYACARGTGPITWPAPNPPPDSTNSDKKAPTPPGPLTVKPSP